MENIRRSLEIKMFSKSTQPGSAKQVGLQQVKWYGKINGDLVKNCNNFEVYN